MWCEKLHNNIITVIEITVFSTIKLTKYDCYFYTSIRSITLFSATPTSITAIASPIFMLIVLLACYYVTDTRIAIGAVIVLTVLGRASTVGSARPTLTLMAGPRVQPRTNCRSHDKHARDRRTALLLRNYKPRST